MNEKAEIIKNLIPERSLRLIDRILFVFNVRTKRFLAWREYNPEDYDFHLGRNEIADTDDPAFVDCPGHNFFREKP